jgi:hypothetical protein
MITFFTTAKPFDGHSAVIQRNALASWKHLHPDVEVILFGDDKGAVEISAELGLRHEPYVERHESGTKYLHFMFARASQIARHRFLCFANCDIVLMDDFWTAFERTRVWRKRFLMVAQRWDTDVTEPIDFDQPTWANALRLQAQTKGLQQDEWWIDFFLFPKGMYIDMPSLIVGHCYWDNWMISEALSTGTPVVDASLFVMPVHQNHGYNPTYGRIKGEGSDPLSQYNLELAGGLRRIRHIKSATHVLRKDGETRFNIGRYTYKLTHSSSNTVRMLCYKVWLPAWHFVLNVTRPLRNVLGLRPKVKRLRS